MLPFPAVKQSIVTLDMEGVLTPEIWIAVAEKTGIKELRRTTRDEPDYDKLMLSRLAILDQHGLKLLSFTLSAALAGLAGALFASLNGFVNPAFAGLDSSLNLFIAMLVGGVGTLVGPVLGMSLLTVIQQAIAPIALYQALIFGGILLISMVLVPTGLVGTWRSSRFGRRAAPARPPSRDVGAGAELAHLCGVGVVYSFVGDDRPRRLGHTVADSARGGRHDRPAARRAGCAFRSGLVA